MNTNANFGTWWLMHCHKLPGARAAVLFLLLCQGFLQADAQTYSVLHDFDKSAGYEPQGTLLVSGGTVYGTAAFGVASPYYRYGSAFKLQVNGLGFSVLKVWGSSETADSTPESGLVLSGSTLYGTALGYRPYGAVFKVETSGSDYAVLKHFTGSDGCKPTEGLVLSGSTLYGTTCFGGSADYGTVFRLNTDGGGFSLLKEFGLEGGHPNAPLVLSGTTLYGTTSSGGSSSSGTVFRISTDGSGYAVLKEFSGPDGRYPEAGLVLAGATLYGTTFQGGNSDQGTVFKLNTDGTGFAVLKQFTGIDGCYPETGVLISGSRIYGTTYGGALGWQGSGSISGNGVLFKINTNGTGFVLLKQFAGDDGSRPEGGLAFSGNAVYGTTVVGGTYNVGTVFRLDLPDAPQVTLPPVEQVAVNGSSATFTVDALGVEPLAYQWCFQGTNLISNATDSVLQLTSVQFSQAGPYTVVITNSFGAVTSPPALLRVIAGSTMTNCAEADLRALMAAGGAVTVNCDGVITLGSTLTVGTDFSLDATGHQLSVSGSDAVRVLCVNTNVSFAAINLTIANGAGPEGAGIYNDGGTLNLLRVCCREHLGTNWPPTYYAPTGFRGAAIFNHAGIVNATECSFIRNTLPAGAEMTAQGGAIFNDSGWLNLQNCLFQSNSALAGSSSGNGMESSGGAIHNEGTLRASACEFVQNFVTGGTGADRGSPGDAGLPGGAARGGAICNLSSMVLAQSLLASNTVVGGAGGYGGNGGYGPAVGGPGGAGGAAYGAALFVSGPSSLVNCTLTGDQPRGGPGGRGGQGGGYIDPRTLNPVEFPGGAGGFGGQASGVVYDLTGALCLTNCTIAFNSSVGGPGGYGGGGNPPGPVGAGGTAAGAIETTAGIAANCLLAGNSPTNCTGQLADAGHNLSSDLSCAFTNVGSLNNTDAKLGPLADNGGPTLTMELLPGSPAIDAGNTSLAPATDQRGVPRPFSLAVDIGAFEFWPTLRASPTGSGGINILASGISGQTCRLLASSNFLNWMPLATNQIGSGGTVLFQDTCAPGSACRYYRLVMP